MTVSDGNFDDTDQLADLRNIHDFDVYNGQNEKVGKVVKAGVTEVDRSPYLILKLGSWLASRQVLLSLPAYRVNPKAQRIDIDGWSKEKINQLPSYPHNQLEDAYAALETSASLESGAQLEAPIVKDIYRSTNPITNPVETSPSSQNVQRAAAPINEEVVLSESTTKILDERIIPLLSERVIVDRHKRKAGEIVVRKVIETEIIEVVVRREKLIVEQVSPEYKELAVIDLGQTSVEKPQSS